MNDLYDTVIEHRGRLYRYDPDFDCFYPIQAEPTTHMSKYGWIYVCAVTLIIALYFTIHPL